MIPALYSDNTIYSGKVAYWYLVIFSIVLYFYDSYTFYLNEIICFSSILKVELKKSKEKSI